MNRKNNKTVRRRARFDGGDSAGYIRSRTISSYDPSNDESAKEAVLERTLEQKRGSRQRRVTTVLVSIGAAIGLVLLATTQIAFNVSSVNYQQDGVTADRDEQYLEFANQYLAGHPSERFLWMLHDSEFLAEAQKTFPEISKITITNNIINGSRVNLTLRVPVAVWRSGLERNYVDQDGKTFSKNYFDEPNITITDLNQSGLVNGISSRMLEFIGKTIAGIESSGVGKVREVSIPVSAARYVEMRLTDRDFLIKVQIDRDVDSQITDIKNMVKYLDDRNLKPNYIDVRIKNRGFWR
jgi:cell division septal protein FtsQ